MSTLTTKQFSQCPQAVHAFTWIHRGTGTFGFGRRGGGGDGDLFARKDYAVPECLSFVIGIQKHLYSMKRKTVYYSHTEWNGSNSRSSYFETLHTLRSLSTVYTRSSKIRNLSKKVISPVALSENVNYPVHTVHNDLIALLWAWCYRDDCQNRCDKKFVFVQYFNYGCSWEVKEVFTRW